MKRKKVICLLAFITMLIGVQPLAMQAVKVEKAVSGVEVYSYTTGTEYDIAENNGIVMVKETSYCLSLKTVCPDGFGRNIHVLLQDIDRKVYRISINAEKQYVEEICLTSEKYTVVKIAILNDFINKYIGLHIGVVYIGMDEKKLFGVMVAMGENITEHPFQIFFLNKLMVGIFLFVVIMFGLYFYDKYLRASPSVYDTHGDMYFEDNMKQYSRGFLSNLAVIAEGKRIQVIVQYVPYKEAHERILQCMSEKAEMDECIRQSLILADKLYLKLNGKWMQRNGSIITYDADRAEKQDI